MSPFGLPSAGYPAKRPLACVQQFPSCLIYAGFKRIAPDQDTGMDLNEPWIAALELFNPESGD